jgi:rubrerythrin
MVASALSIGGEAIPEQLSRFRCADCGYGASCKSAPVRCPMCSGKAWEYEDRRRAADVDWPLGREAAL